jgi:hypothetical protein
MNKKTKITPSIPQKQASQRRDILDTAPTSGGKTKLLKYLYGDKLTRNSSIVAKCCDCMGDYFDGRVDCEISICPLYPFMPYREKRG